MDTEARTLLACPHCGATNRAPSARLADDPVCGRCGTELADGRPFELTDANFDAFVRASGLPVVVDFWADWCGPCHQMAPQFAQAATRLKGQAVFVKVNSDQNPQVSSRFGIRSIPTLVRLSGGREVGRMSGARPAAAITQFATE